MTNKYLLNQSQKQGFTLVEIVVVVVILIIIATIVVMPFSQFRNQQILAGAADNILTLVNQARSQTLAAKNDLNYGVYFATSSVTIFSGSIYDQEALDNKEIILSDKVNISDISIGGAGDSSIIFSRLTGITNASGTVTVSLVSSIEKNKVILINEAGIASIVE